MIDHCGINSRLESLYSDHYVDCVVTRQAILEKESIVNKMLIIKIQKLGGRNPVSFQELQVKMYLTDTVGRQINAKR